jgi:bifunctional UDP-N-acetylglucosamine pyrophosphorylase/glucosamine-1-phosphate N-acetyltransferase
MSIRVVLLAAGKGTRMKSDEAKVLHSAAGRTLLAWSFEALSDVDVAETSVVVGHHAQAVAAACPEGVATVIQDPQNGTGHAASVGLSGLTSTDGTILVLPGDMPLIRPDSIRRLVDAHVNADAAATIMSVSLPDPTGYGRIVRSDGHVVAVVEERDATPEVRAIDEVNTSVYVFDGPALVDALARITPDNDQGEYYLTDVIGILAGHGGHVGTMSVAAEEGIGVNTQGQLAEVAAVLRSRINAGLLDAGVSMLDPSRAYVDAGVVVEPGARLLADVYLEGATRIAAGATVGPGVRMVDTSVGAGATIQNAVCVSARVEEGATVGPFAYLRPGAVVGRGAKVGSYVEVKASSIGEGSKVPHLSYIGDATIGRGTNIGAGTITVNYDGYTKHRTVIGDNVRIGSDTMLVAPVTVGDDAFTGAGSVVTQDVPDGALAVERTTQKNVDGYAEKRRRRAMKGDS